MTNVQQDTAALERRFLPEPHIRTGLSKSPILEGVPTEALLSLEKRCNWIQTPAETLVVASDEASDGVFFVITGEVRVCFRVFSKPDVNLALMGPGELFGELAALDGQGRSADVVANVHSVLAVCPSTDFQDLLRQYPEVALRLLRRFAWIIRRADSQILRLAKLTASQRIYLEMLRLALPDPSGDGTWMISPAPLHRDIAAWAGSETDDVGRALGHLMRAGIVRRTGQNLVILDRTRLETLSMLPAADLYRQVRTGG